ncbi:MAG: PAS domain-containing protein [Methylobacterium sp.]
MLRPRDDTRAPASWPFCTGAMADGIRAHDWTATPLGPIADWPAALTYSVGSILESRFASIIVWGPERIGLYNDACIPVIGDRPNPLGHPFDIAWADVWGAIGHVYESAFAGHSSYFEDLPLDVPRPGLPDLSWWTFSCSPIRDKTGRIGGVRATILETTARVTSERRQSLLIRVGDALRGSSDAGAMATAACAELGRHFGADRVGYAEIDVENALVRVGQGWTCDERPYQPISFALSAFGAAFVDCVRSGEATAVSDVGRDPLTAGCSIYESLGIGAFLAVPLIRQGRWTNALSVAKAQAHPWTPDEVSIVADAAERIWEAVERARAEASLRESGRRLDAALEAARMVAWDWDPAADRARLSSGAEAVYGLRPGETITSSVDGMACVHPDDRERHMATVMDAGAALRSYESEFRVVRQTDGETAWLEERARPEIDPTTGATILTGLVWDVTRRKSAELASEQARREVADELAVLTRLHGWAVRVGQPSEWQALLDEMLAATVHLLNADFGTIRIYDPDQETLTICAQLGCAADYVDRFAVASVRDPGSIWHRPMSLGARVIYDEMDSDPEQHGLRATACEFRFRAVQVTPLFDRSGAPVGALSTGFFRLHRPSDREWRLVDLYGAQIADAIGAKQARDAVATSEQRQRRLIENVPQLVWRSAWDGHATWHSPQWFAYTGHSREDSLDRGWLDAMHPDDRPAIMKAWSKARERGAYEVECRIWSAREGRYRWFQERAIAEQIGDAAEVEWIGTSTDIDALRTLHEHQRTLLAELQHRVRHTLSQLRTIVRRTAETRDDFDAYVLRLDSRLGALARAQGPALRDPSAGVDLAELVANELTAHQAREGERASVSGPPLRLRPGAADILALALHELAINAVEHGALARERGRIRVSWHVADDDGDAHLNFTWTEVGCTMPGGAGPMREGFGFSFLKRTLADAFKAETVITLAPRGLNCTIALPLTGQVVLP